MLLCPILLLCLQNLDDTYEVCISDPPLAITLGIRISKLGIVTIELSFVLNAVSIYIYGASPSAAGPLDG